MKYFALLLIFSCSHIKSPEHARDVASDKSGLQSSCLSLIKDITLSHPISNRELDEVLESTELKPILDIYEHPFEKNNMALYLAYEKRIYGDDVKVRDHFNSLLSCQR